MEFFIDTAEIEEIKKLNATGLVDGVTTNPSLIAKSGKDFHTVIKEICAEITHGPVSAEVISTNADEMIEEGKKLADLAENVCVKLPLTYDGLIACKKLSDNNIQTNVTLCFSSSQALLAAKAGATYISPFVGRLDDLSQNGLDLIEEITTIYDNYPNLQTKVLVASVRNPLHVTASAMMGADVVTLPPKLLMQLMKHPLTDSGLDQFLKDYQKAVGA